MFEMPRGTWLLLAAAGLVLATWLVPPRPAPEPGSAGDPEDRSDVPWSLLDVHESRAFVHTREVWVADPVGLSLGDGFRIEEGVLDVYER